MMDKCHYMQYIVEMLFDRDTYTELSGYLYTNGAKDLDRFSNGPLISIRIALKIAHSFDIHITLTLMYVIHTSR
jgi:hypothetical protein